jgi:hypothetical protein
MTVTIAGTFPADKVKAFSQAKIQQLSYRVFKIKYVLGEELREYVFYEVIDQKPSNFESLTFMDRCGFELIAEQSEGAKGDGSETFTITKRMVDARVMQKLREEKGN